MTGLRACRHTAASGGGKPEISVSCSFINAEKRDWSEHTVFGRRTSTKSIDHNLTHRVTQEQPALQLARLNNTRARSDTEWKTGRRDANPEIPSQPPTATRPEESRREEPGVVRPRGLTPLSSRLTRPFHHTRGTP